MEQEGAGRVATRAGGAGSARKIAHAPCRGNSHNPEPAQRLRILAVMVEKLGVGGRTDPEQIVLAKFGIARELRRVARELAA